MKSSTCYFHIKMKVFAEFQICIGVPLNIKIIDWTIGNSECEQLLGGKIDENVNFNNHISDFNNPIYDFQ